MDYNKEKEEEYEEEKQENEEEEEEEEETKCQDTQTPSRFLKKNHPENLILSDKHVGTWTRRKLAIISEQMNISLLSKIEPRCFEETNNDQHWINAMEHELNQIEKNHTWELVPRLKDKNVIGTKWVFRNKSNEYGKVVRNKARLVCKGYSQVEGIDFE